MADRKPPPVPGVPSGALDAITDPNAQQVMRALVDGWHVRNGVSGAGGNRFVTADELGVLQGRVGGIVSSLPGAGGGSRSSTALTSAEINQLVGSVQSGVLNSPLWAELGSHITMIDLDALRERQDRIAQVQLVADDLSSWSATTLGLTNVQGSAINHLLDTSNNQVLEMSGMVARIGSNESTIINLQQVTSTQATDLRTLDTQSATSASNITDLRQTTAMQASSLFSLSTRTGDSESSVSDLRQTTANTASLLTSLYTRVDGNEAAITSEQMTRSSHDEAMTSFVTTQLSAVNGNQGVLQQTNTTLATTVSAMASSVLNLQASVAGNTSSIEVEASTRANVDGELYGKYSVKIDQNGYVCGFGLMSTANATSTPYSDFIVRADRFALGSPSITSTLIAISSLTRPSGGSSTGAALYTSSPHGLSATDTTKNKFVISGAADEKWNRTWTVGWVGSTTYLTFTCTGAEDATGAGATGLTRQIGKVTVPFVVLTTTDAKGNPPGVYMDSAYIKNAAIGTAQIDLLAVNEGRIAQLAVTQGKIGDLAVGTLQIAGYSVVVPTIFATTPNLPMSSRTVSGKTLFGSCISPWTDYQLIGYQALSIPVLPTDGTASVGVGFSLSIQASVALGVDFAGSPTVDIVVYRGDGSAIYASRTFYMSPRLDPGTVGRTKFQCVVSGIAQDLAPVGWTNYFVGCRITGADMSAGCIPTLDSFGMSLTAMKR